MVHQSLILWNLLIWYQRKPPSDTIAPCVQHEDLQDHSAGIQEAREFTALFPYSNAFSQYDLGQDLGVAVNNPELHQMLPVTAVDDFRFYTMCQKLNLKQNFFYHCLHWFKTKTDPIYLFLTTGAGVGKSLVLHALYQALNRSLGKIAGQNPDNLRILLCAPTGKETQQLQHLKPVYFKGPHMYSTVATVF